MMIRRSGVIDDQRLPAPLERLAMPRRIWSGAILEDDPRAASLAEYAGAGNTSGAAHAREGGLRVAHRRRRRDRPRDPRSSSARTGAAGHRRRSRSGSTPSAACAATCCGSSSHGSGPARSPDRSDRRYADTLLGLAPAESYVHVESQSVMAEAVIVSAVRVPTGKFLGTLKDFPAPELGALVVREAVARAGIDPAIVDECIMGNVVSARRRPGAGAAGRAQGRAVRSRRRAHHQQGVRLGPQGRDAGAPGHPDRRHRDRRGRRHGVDEQLPVPARRGVREGLRMGHGAGRRLDDSRRAVVPVRGLAHGQRRRDRRRRLQGVARGAGRVRRREPQEGRRRPGEPARSRTRSCRCRSRRRRATR